MVGHGPDAETAEKASEASLEPTKVREKNLTFMFENVFMVGVMEWGLERCGKMQERYNVESWTGTKRRFRAPRQQE
jgi:homogentisate 1,2-dioxygenase